MANAVFSAVYKALEDRSDDLARIGENSRHQLRDLPTLDILTKVFMVQTTA